MGTHTVRVLDDDYEKAIELLEAERKKPSKTRMQELVKSSETNWLSNLLNLGIKVYKSNRKIGENDE
jgi:hypothetical protein